MLAAAARSGEERVLAIEGDRPDGALDDVGVDLDPAVIEEPNKAVPATQAIAIASAIVLFRETAASWVSSQVLS